MATGVPSPYEVAEAGSQLPDWYSPTARSVKLSLHSPTVGSERLEQSPPLVGEAKLD